MKSRPYSNKVRTKKKKASYPSCLSIEDNAPFKCGGVLFLSFVSVCLLNKCGGIPPNF